MAAHVDDLTVSYTEEGVETVRQLDKVILSKGAWTTIIFKCQDWDKQKQCYKAPKYTIRRYQKKNDSYWMQSKFNISSADQATKIIEALSRWVAQDGSAAEPAAGDSE
jgi:hypothetical protein